MYAAQHADACYKKFGNQYYEIHEFLDQFSQEFRGVEHRMFLHHKLGVDLVVQRFGEEARGPAELHIRQDTEGQLPDDWSFYGNPIHQHAEEQDKHDAILRGLYGEEVFDMVESKLK